MSDQASGRTGPPSRGAPNGSANPETNAACGPNPNDTHMLGATLAPAVIRACDDRLVDLHWFRTDWQRGGAMTGYAKFQTPAGDRPVVLKFPVPPRELRWMQRLQADQHDAGEVVPKLYASGTALNGYDLAWIVMERMPHGPLDSTWQGREWDHLVEALGRFYAACEAIPVDREPREEDWPAIVKRARQALRAHGVAEEQRWNKAIKALQKKLTKTLEAWDARDVNHWCHGDVHLANAMTRHAAPDGPALLFDLAEVHAGHWVEDAVYIEHLYWAAPQRLAGRQLVKTIAEQRKAHGLKMTRDWPTLANIRRALLAAAAPAYLHQEGNPQHVHAALERLEQTLGQLPV